MSMEGGSAVHANERKPEDIRYRATDAAVGMFVDEFKGDEGVAEKSEAVRAIMNEFFEQQLENTEMHESFEHGASFLHSAIDSGELAKKLYERFAGSLPELRPRSEDGREAIHAKRHDEFIFSSFFKPTNPAALFVFFEQGLNQLVQKLPAAFEDIKRGVEPAQHVVHYVGTPTRDIAHISPQFVDSLKGGRAFEVFGDMYADLVKEYAKDGNEISLRGISMGAPFAIETAQKLKADGVVTQDIERAESSHVPHLSVRIDTPSSQNDTQSVSRQWQVPVGFAIDGIMGMFNDKMSRASANPFAGSLVEQLKPALARKGIREEMSPEDAALKKEAIKLLHDEFYKGITVPTDLKVTEVIGKSDHTMFVPFSGPKKEFARAAEEQRSKHEGSLGETRVSEAGSSRKTYAAEMTHAMPNTTSTVLRRLKRAAEAVKDLSN